MSAPTNTFLTSSAIGNRESLHDIISTLNKDETPFLSAIGSEDAEATYEEWQKDDLGSANSTNYQPEGNNTTANAITPTVRVGNRLQILNKPFTISGTQEAVRKAGRSSEISYQKALAGRRLKMDIEAFMCGNQASTSADPRKMGGYESWMTSNVSRGTTGSSGGFTSGNTVAATDGTQRTFTEVLLKAVVKSAWDNGGRPSWLLMGSFNKQIFSTFTGIATQYQEAKGRTATVVAAVDRYISDFGTFNAAASRYVRTRSALVVDPELFKSLWLRRIYTEELAKTGDARNYDMRCEVTLMVKNEAGSGIVADLTTS
jgi:hypothetical protein